MQPGNMRTNKLTMPALKAIWNAGTCQLDNDVVDKELPNILAVLNGEK